MKKNFFIIFLSIFVILFSIEIILNYLDKQQNKIIQFGDHIQRNKNLDFAHESIIQNGNDRIIKLNENKSNSHFYAFIGKNSKSFEYPPNFKKGFEIKVDRHGFIGSANSYSANNFNIIFSGGSTTENRFVENKYRFPYLVGEILKERKINTYNDGKSGRSGLETIIKTLASNVDLKPKIIVFYHNINSLNTLEHSYNLKYNSTILLKEEKLKKIKIQEIIFPNIVKKINSLKNSEQKKTRRVRDYSPKKIKYMEKQFRRQLDLFVSICRIYNILPILMTQPSLMQDDIDENWIFFESNEIKNVKNLVYLHSKFNSIIINFAKDKKILAIDLAGAYSWTSKELYDGFHFSKEGNIIAAKYIAEKISQNLF